ncbi:MAG: hypothetical protein AABZ24_11820, partial [Nitrospirota bacterium]
MLIGVHRARVDVDVRVQLDDGYADAATFQQAPDGSDGYPFPYGRYNPATYEYELTYNNVTKMTDSMGNITQYFYDSKGNLVQIKNALNYQTFFLYTEQGLLYYTRDHLFLRVA